MDLAIYRMLMKIVFKLQMSERTILANLVTCRHIRTCIHRLHIHAYTDYTHICNNCLHTVVADINTVATSDASWLE